MSDDLMSLDATAQAELVRAGQVSPAELVTAAVDRIEAVNPALNAVITPLFEQAARAAAATLPDGPFRGVPLLLKDIGACQAGQPQYSGNRLLRSLAWRCPADSALGARFRTAGFVVVGVTNTAELGSQPTTQPVAFGPTRNPWDPTRSVSGSSGGAAAAVSAGMTAVAHGTDVSGSIRMPASWCGAVGLKPSRGRTSVGPVTARDLTEHVITRTVRDSAAVLDAVSGPEPGDLYTLPAPEQPYTLLLGREPRRLRVGVTSTVEASGIAAAPDCIAAVESAARLLEKLGHEVIPAGPPGLFDDEFVTHWRTVASTKLAHVLDALASAIGRPLTAADVEPYTWAFASAGTESVRQYLLSEDWLQTYSARIERWWTDGFDLLVTPTTGEPPAPLDELLPPAADPLAVLPRFLGILCFAVPFNITGQPAISLPLHWTAAGLPVGVQLVARHGREDLLLAMAAALEQAQPWAGRSPRGP